MRKKDEGKALRDAGAQLSALITLFTGALGFGAGFLLRGIGDSETPVFETAVAILWIILIVVYALYVHSIHILGVAQAESRVLSEYMRGRHE